MGLELDLEGSSSVGELGDGGIEVTGAFNEVVMKGVYLGVSDVELQLTDYFDDLRNFCSHCFNRQL